MTAKLLAFSGSTRKGSFSTALLHAAAKTAHKAGAEVTVISLGDYPAPIFNEDDEAANGMPATITALKQLVADHDGLIVSTPEYNGFPSPLLYNTFGWLTRTATDGSLPRVLQGKTAAIMASSPGSLGGIRVIPRLRDTLAELGITVINGYVTLPGAGGAFADDGTLTAENTQKQLDDVMGRLVGHVSA